MRSKPTVWKRLLAGVAAAMLVTWAVWAYLVKPVDLPPPRPARPVSSVSQADFVGAQRCAQCHQAVYSVWKRSTHGRAGGVPSPDLVIAPFNGTPIRFADAVVTPRVRAGVWEFAIQQPDEPLHVLRVDGVVGGGHIYGGGTQGFVTRLEDGTMRFLPFEWSRQGRTWFCNTNSRTGHGWAPITRTTRLTDCGDWPPTRVFGDIPRFANCQSCHASQASVALDTTTHKYETRMTSLEINCESCHGPGRKHVELAENGTLAQSADIGLASLRTLDKDASLRVCYQCHAVKDRLLGGFLSGDSLATYYSTKLPLLGDRPLHPDGRIRTFAYQEGHQYSDCYLNGGMTCVSCHDPHDQQYRDVVGTPLQGRFDDRQCTSCHASKADRVMEHTRHASRAVSCTSCHMPLRQEPETRALDPNVANRDVVPYARSDHTISIPRPRLDASLGLVGACAACHTDRSPAELEARIREWWGELKPLTPMVAQQLRFSMTPSDSSAAGLLLGAAPDTSGGGHAYAVFAGLSRYLEEVVRVDGDLDRASTRRLEELALASDVDVRATALAALHLAKGENRSTRRRLGAALRAEGSGESVLRSRWAVVAGFMGDRYASQGKLRDAIVAYQRALEVQPADARLLLSLGNAQRDAGDPAAAVASYSRGLALAPSDPLIWVNLGIAQGTRGDTSSAIEALSRAATLNPFEPLAWFNLGNILLMRGDLQRASVMYARTAALDPSTALAHFQLARVDLLQRNEAGALRHLRRGLAFDSSDAQAREMAVLLARRLMK
jgi:tetratricopeptide (TPR) repeat protein